MIKMRPYVPSNHIAVRDSVDEDISDDIDDDVFIKDARSSKSNDEKGVKRPLMNPRRKNGKIQDSGPIMKKHRHCWRCCEPFCYGLAVFTIIISIISFAALMLTMFPQPMQKIKVWFKPDSLFVDVTNIDTQFSTYGSSMGSEFVPCTQISVQKVWVKTFFRMNSESPVRKSDLNGDGIKDIIFGYGVDDSIQSERVTLPKCKSAQNDDEILCEGGVIAVNGANGELLWQSWSIANVFSLLCTLDIDRDGYPDCVAAGRLGMIFAINGRNGNNIWEFHEAEVETNSPIIMDLYTINLVRDLDGDEVPEILAAHLEERDESKSGHIKIISGRLGKVIRTIPTPFKEEVFVPLQVITKRDGTELLVIITGGQTTPGGIYSVRLLSLMKFTSEKEFTPLLQNNSSGLMVPSVITDITGDGVADIVVSSFNSTVFAFDGYSYSHLWNFTFPNSESVSEIVPGHFNRDNVTDFMVKYNTGPGFPVYYYSQTTILDGKTGTPLLDAMMTDSGGSNSLLGGVSISQSFGGDFFLHWQMQCRGKYNAKDVYKFIPDSDIILQARADTCRLRYNESTVVKLYAIARHLEPPGAVLFSTDDLEVQLKRTKRIKTNKQNLNSPLKHPKLLKKLLANRAQLLKNVAVAENIINNEVLSNNIQPKRLKENSLLNPILEQEVLQEILPNNDLSANNAFEQVKEYFGNNYPKDYESENPHTQAEEYDMLYNDNDTPQELTQKERPIRLRSKYPGNRDIRSDISTFDNSGNETQPLSIGGVPKNNLDKQEPLNLWDLEMEKEERDALKNTHKYDYVSEDQNMMNKLKRAENTITVSETSSTTTAFVEDNNWFLASISSTGVLLKSLNGSKSSLDFVFILNIRESETYPPLLLAQDLKCVEKKISAYKSYTAENMRLLKNQLLKKCLSERLGNISPSTPRYESQLEVVRISISCSCHSLLKGEVCSELDDVEAQRWTEFMGNDCHGFYAN
ncbi:uncharacterized protein LOC119678428 [Teleopsis dalmanni]|uniref:uncharacterized protein LOC119678428 n=1 Tax=Teleopsis dalmanni TaxID=139649 RepID=UPI000D32B829|nr:uncharacterized protein LOC119678428 [Teleopsis dalmanni]